MELRAVIAALEEAERSSPGAPVVLNTDSQYVKNGITSWINSWKRNGWRTADKKPVKNRELWEELDAVASRVRPRFQWVKGHAGIESNERCDAMVQAEIRKFC
jgi:ribonuclease HI